MTMTGNQSDGLWASESMMSSGMMSSGVEAGVGGGDGSMGLGMSLGNVGMAEGMQWVQHSEQLQLPIPMPVGKPQEG